MPQSGFTPIINYNTATASAVPLAANLNQGELAINVTDKKIYTKNSGGAVVQIGSGPDTTETLTNKTITTPLGLTKTDVGLGNVDNTADTSKPVSTLQQTALDLKINTSAKDASGGVPGLTLFKLNLRNAANTITNFFQIAVNTVARTWTMPDKDGTVAMTSDITGGTSAGSFTTLSASGNVTLGDVSTDTVSIPGTLTSGKHTAKQSAETGSAFGLTAERSTNDSFIAMGYHSTGDSFRVQASYTSTGAYKPLTFWTLDNERMRIGTDGAVTIPGSLTVTGSIFADYGLKIGTATQIYEAGRLGYTDANHGFLYRPPRVGVLYAHAFQSFAGASLFNIDDNGNGVFTKGTLGYGTGAGGTVTQTGSRSSAVVFATAKSSGSIQMVSASGSATWIAFQVVNPAVAVGDGVILSVQVGASNYYMMQAVNIVAGAFYVLFAASGTVVDAPIVNFQVIKGATS